MSGKKEKYLVAALKFIERGQLDKALGELANVVAEDPGDTRTLLKMAELQTKLGAAAEATETYLRTGELYAEQGFAQKAAAVYKNALKLSPGSAKAHLRLGSLYEQLGLVSDAIHELELAAGALQRGGAIADAIAAFQQAIAAQPDNVVLRVKLAEAASQGGLIDEAVREFERAAEQLKAQGRVDEALRVLERLLFHQPDNAAKARELAEAYIARGSARLALPKLQTCMKAWPRDPAVLLLLARALEQLGQPDKAVSVLKDLARLAHEVGRTGDRAAAIDRALALRPGDPEVQALALRYRGQGGAPGMGATPPPAARHEPGGVVRPDDAGSASGRVAIPLGVGETSARIMASSSPGATPDVARILAESEVFVKYGLLERAVDHLGRVFALDPENRTARERLSHVLQKLGRNAEAARQLELLSRQLARQQPAEARALAERAARLDPAGARGPAANGARSGPHAARDSRPVMLLDVDEDPAIEVVTPPPEIEVGVTPLPVESGPSADQAGFEENVLTGDVVEVTEAAPRAVSLDWDEAAAQATPPPARPSRARARATGSQAPVDVAPARAEATVVDRWGAPPITPPPAAPEDEDLEADLEQVAFFLDQGIAEEARALLEELRRRYPGDRRVQAKLREVEVFEAREAAGNLGVLPHAGNMARGGAEPAPPRAVVEAGGPPDASTHLDLGVAYKEMGLYDAAIAELKAVTRDPLRQVEALTLLGECFEAKGSFTEAIIRYKQALNCTPITADEITQLYFVLGGAFDRLGDASEALYFFEKVARRTPTFRDVDRRIAALRPKPMKTAP